MSSKEGLKYNPFKEGLDEQLFKKGDIVYYMKRKGKILKTEYNSYLGFICLVKYNLFSKKWCLQSSLTPTCESCKNNKTMKCPNSGICYDTEAKPYYISKNKVVVNEEVNQ